MECKDGNHKFSKELMCCYNHKHCKKCGVCQCMNVPKHDLNTTIANDYSELIKKAHQEAHECNASAEVHGWIDWFENKLK